MVKNINVLIKKIGIKFKENNISLVTAESCTGGGLAFYISKSPDCSSILERGYITYSNPSKEDILKVSQESLQTQGAVSKNVAIEMAIGALKKSHAQISISITGVSGADLKSKTSIGIVWISCIDVFGHTLVKQKKIQGNRSVFIQKVIYEAAILLLLFVSKNFSKSSKKYKL